MALPQVLYEYQGIRFEDDWLEYTFSYSCTIEEYSPTASPSMSTASVSGRANVPVNGQPGAGSWFGSVSLSTSNTAPDYTTSFSVSFSLGSITASLNESAPSGASGRGTMKSYSGYMKLYLDSPVVLNSYSNVYHYCKGNTSYVEVHEDRLGTNRTYIDSNNSDYVTCSAFTSGNGMVAIYSVPVISWPSVYATGYMDIQGSIRTAFYGNISPVHDIRPLINSINIVDCPNPPQPYHAPAWMNASSGVSASSMHCTVNFSDSDSIPSQFQPYQHAWVGFHHSLPPIMDIYSHPNDSQRKVWFFRNFTYDKSFSIFPFLTVSYHSEFNSTPCGSPTRVFDASQSIQTVYNDNLTSGAQYAEISPGLNQKMVESSSTSWIAPHYLYEGAMLEGVASLNNATTWRMSAFPMIQKGNENINTLPASDVFQRCMNGISQQQSLYFNPDQYLIPIKSAYTTVSLPENIPTNHDRLYPYARNYLQRQKDPDGNVSFLLCLPPVVGQDNNTWFFYTNAWGRPKQGDYIGLPLASTSGTNVILPIRETIGTTTISYLNINPAGINYDEVNQTVIIDTRTTSVFSIQVTKSNFSTSGSPTAPATDGAWYGHFHSGPALTIYLTPMQYNTQSNQWEEVTTNYDTVTTIITTVVERTIDKGQNVYNPISLIIQGTKVPLTNTFQFQFPPISTYTGDEDIPYFPMGRQIRYQGLWYMRGTNLPFKVIYSQSLPNLPGTENGVEKYWEPILKEYFTKDQEYFEQLTSTTISTTNYVNPIGMMTGIGRQYLGLQFQNSWNTPDQTVRFDGFKLQLKTQKWLSNALTTIRATPYGCVFIYQPGSTFKQPSSTSTRYYETFSVQKANFYGSSGLTGTITTRCYDALHVLGRWFPTFTDTEHTLERELRETIPDAGKNYEPQITHTLTFMLSPRYRNYSTKSGGATNWDYTHVPNICNAELFTSGTEYSKTLNCLQTWKFFPTTLNQNREAFGTATHYLGALVHREGRVHGRYLFETDEYRRILYIQSWPDIYPSHIMNLYKFNSHTSNLETIPVFPPYTTLTAFDEDPTQGTILSAGNYYPYIELDTTNSLTTTKWNPSHLETFVLATTGTNKQVIVLNPWTGLYIIRPNIYEVQSTTQIPFNDRTYTYLFFPKDEYVLGKTGYFALKASDLKFFTDTIIKKLGVGTKHRTIQEVSGIRFFPYGAALVNYTPANYTGNWSTDDPPAIINVADASILSGTDFDAIFKPNTVPYPNNMQFWLMSSWIPKAIMALMAGNQTNTNIRGYTIAPVSDATTITIGTSHDLDNYWTDANNTCYMQDAIASTYIDEYLVRYSSQKIFIPGRGKVTPLSPGSTSYQIIGVSALNQHVIGAWILSAKYPYMVAVEPIPINPNINLTGYYIPVVFKDPLVFTGRPVVFPLLGFNDAILLTSALILAFANNQWTVNAELRLYASEAVGQTDKQEFQLKLIHYVSVPIT